MLLSTFNHVYQSLAEMISWADDILIEGKDALDKEIASKKITAVQDSVTVSMRMSLLAIVIIINLYSTIFNNE